MNTASPTDYDWHIIGAGSIGLLWAFHLSQAGKRVCLIFKDEKSLKLYQLASGIRYQGVDTSLIIKPDATHVGIIHHRVNKLIVCTKANDAAKAIQSIKPSLEQQANIILLANGMGYQSEVATVLEQQTLICGITTEGVYQSERFHLHHVGIGQTDIGLYSAGNNAKQDNIAAAIIEALDCGLSVKWEASIEISLVKKLLMNTAINLLCTLYQCRNGDLLRDNNIHAHFQRLMPEIIAFAQAHSLAPALTQIDTEIKAVIHATAENYCSMLNDFQAQRPNELEYIGGYFLNHARKLNIDTPESQNLYDALKEKF